MSKEVVVVEESLDSSTSKILILKGEVAKNIYEIGLELKKVRDSKSYKEKYGTFEQYCEVAVDFTRFSAYNFIKICETYSVETIQQISYSKLLEIKKLPESVREEAIQKVTDEGLSVSETKEAVKNWGEHGAFDKPLSERTTKGLDLEHPKYDEPKTHTHPKGYDCPYCREHKKEYNETEMIAFIQSLHSA